MSETWELFLRAIRSGDPLVYAGLSAVAAFFAFVLVRRLMRVGWLRVAMRLGFFGGVLALVVLAAFSLSYYQWQAWLPLGGSVLASTFSSPVSWLLAAVVVAVGLALRKPVPPRNGVRVSAPRPVPVFEEPPEAEAASQPPNVVAGPWRKVA